MWKSIKKFFKWIADHTGISWVARKISSGWKWLFGGKKSETRITKQNTSQQRKSTGGEGQTLPKTLDNVPKHLVIVEPSEQKTTDNLEEQNNPAQTYNTDNQADVKHPQKLEPVINSISESKGKLKLSLNNIDILCDKFNTDPAELKCLYIKCDKGVFKITIDKFLGLENNCASFSIKSVERHISETRVDKVEKFAMFLIGAELSRQKSLLGLKKNNPIVHITQISKNPIMVPKSEIASSTTTPAASNGQFFSA